MKKLIIGLITIFTLSSPQLQAQELGKGSILTSISGGGSSGGAWGCTLNLEYGLTDVWKPGVFTIGATIGMYDFAKLPDYYMSLFGVRATYRVSVARLLELYAGTIQGLSYYVYPSNEWIDGEYFDTSETTFNKWASVIIAGARLSFSRRVSMFTEICLGSPTTRYNVGIAFNIPY